MTAKWDKTKFLFPTLHYLLYPQAFPNVITGILFKINNFHILHSLDTYGYSKFYKRTGSQALSDFRADKETTISEFHIYQDIIDP